MTTSPLDAAVHICVMGVSGVGKTTVGEQLAERLGRTFGDADDLHSKAAVEKMSVGTPLTDDDRAPWLDAVVAWLDDEFEAENGVVFACSALKRRYRDRIAHAHAPVFFVHLTADPDDLRKRLENRKGHFMHADMLRSQLADLESIDEGEFGVEVRTGESVEATVDAVLGVLERR